MDNNSDDETKDVAARFADIVPLRYVFERRQGLSHARNRALIEAKGDVVIFTDDDVEVTADWLSAFTTTTSRFGSADYFGGRILPRFTNGQPSWLKDEKLALLDGLIGRYDLGESDRPYTQEDPFPYGASFAVRRKLFERLGTFRVDLGVKGRDLGRGEEAEYLLRARALGFQGAYAGAALCYHWNDTTRFRLSNLYRFGIQKGIADGRIAGPKDGSFRSELFYGARGLVQLLKGRGDRFRQCVINMGIQRGYREFRRLYHGAA